MKASVSFAILAIVMVGLGTGLLGSWSEVRESDRVLSLLFRSRHEARYFSEHGQTPRSDGALRLQAS